MAALVMGSAAGWRRLGEGLSVQAGCWLGGRQKGCCRRQVHTCVSKCCWSSLMMVTRNGRFYGEHSD